MYCHQCGRAFSDDDVFCTGCGTKKRPMDISNLGDSEEEIIEYYFRRGFQYSTILCFLTRKHNINMSLRTLKRRLSALNLKKRDDNINLGQLRQIIRTEIQGPSCQLGYRGMWNKLRTTYNITVPRDTVMEILKEIDPEGAEKRKSRKLQRRVYRSGGPNSAWHMDGYDKLKPYGLPIHGCVDGFSRKILWLEVCKTNNNPIMPAMYFLRTVKQLNVLPMKFRTDCGTENGLVAAIQCAFHDDENAHQYGQSIRNQRIENWWSHQRRGFTNWIITYFKELVDDGYLIPGNENHKACVWFVYSKFLQTELDKVKIEWNNHYIRHSNYCEVSGKPDELYFLPETVDYEECGLQVPHDDIEAIIEHENIFDRASDIENENTDPDLKDFFEYIINESRLEYPPKNWECALFMYKLIIDHLN